MKSSLKLSVCKTFEFSAAHRLFRADWTEQQNLSVYGKCANPSGHGHNYKLEIFVSGEIDCTTGMVFDASLLQQIVDEVVIRELDHRNLDTDVHWLQGKPSTVENIALAVWERLAPAIHHAQKNSELDKIILWETNRIFASLERGFGTITSR